MQGNKIDFGTLITTVFLFGFLLLPSITAIHHALTNHTSVVCDSDFPTHYHESEFSCQFQHIVLNKHLYLKTLSVTWYKYVIFNEIELNYFELIFPVQSPYFSLRAPPVAA